MLFITAHHHDLMCSLLNFNAVVCFQIGESQISLRYRRKSFSFSFSPHYAVLLGDTKTPAAMNNTCSPVFIPH